VFDIAGRALTLMADQLEVEIRAKSNGLERGYGRSKSDSILSLFGDVYRLLIMRTVCGKVLSDYVRSCDR
jgi:hypothetical protein